MYLDIGYAFRYILQTIGKKFPIDTIIKFNVMINTPTQATVFFIFFLNVISFIIAKSKGDNFHDNKSFYNKSMQITFF